MIFLLFAGAAPSAGLAQNANSPEETKQSHQTCLAALF